MSDLFKINEMGAIIITERKKNPSDHLSLPLYLQQDSHQKRLPQPCEIRVKRIVNLNNSPWVTTTTDLLTIDHDLLFGTYDCEWEEGLCSAEVKRWA